MKFSLHPIALLILLISSITSMAQFPPAGGRPGGYGQQSGIMLSGQVVESKGEQPIGFATVLLKSSSTDEMIDGTTTDMDGNFRIRTDSTDFYLVVSFMGFKELEIRDLPAGKFKQLGTLRLIEDSQLLKEVDVTAEKSYTEFKLDKRVFNVGKDLSTTGAGALEVLDNIPSVNVNIEGEVSLRGAAGVQILINGKPSVLADQDGNALGSITADMIEKVEVITNPSAKYEAEGTAGIINIVLKKEERKGTNGSVTLNTGYPHNHSLGFSINHRTEKFNFFGQTGAGYRNLPSNKRYLNHDLNTDTIISSTGFEERNETFVNVILGMDYHPNQYNTLTFSGSFAMEFEDQPSEANFSAFFDSSELYSEWQRLETTTAVNPKWQYEFQYQKKFKDHEEHRFDFVAQSSFFGKDLSSEFDNLAVSGPFEEYFQETRTNFKEARYTFKADYSKPIGTDWTVEAGSQLVMQLVSNDFEVTNLINDEWVVDTNQANIFDFDQHVLGAYGIAAYEKKRWGFKAGLRLEHTIVHTLLRLTNEVNDRNYTNLFPSAHLSYKASDRLSFQAGYSRRVRRPRMWSLNPFFNIRNDFSIRTGNPDLDPEFTDSYELNAIWTIAKTSFNAGVYYRYTTGVIERVVRFEDNVSTSTPENLGLRHAPGAEVNVKYEPIKWLTLNGDFNMNYFNRQGSFNGRSIDFDAFQWSKRLNARFDLPLDFDLELTSRYESGFQTVQGRNSDNFGIDFGLRKKLMKGRAIINLSIRDVFASRRTLVENFQPSFFTSNFSRRGRFTTLAFSYGFGKGEAMEFSGRRRMW